MSSSLTHIALHVRDLDACIAFYRDTAGMAVVHDRLTHGKHVVWLASPGAGAGFILVLIPGGPGHAQAPDDFSHLGFAVDSHAAVDAIAARAEAAGCLVWPPRQEAYPVGYYCGLRDPDGNMVEFSYGQPLGPGAPPL
jgi:catechol 2,3-dioxygenase-like lactoylglutathione lyase family enzyme